jgi:hypothetical protein
VRLAAKQPAMRAFIALMAGFFILSLQVPLEITLHTSI